MFYNEWQKEGSPLGPSFAVAAAELHRRPVAAGEPRVTRNYSTAAASSSPTRACFPPTCPSSLLLSQPCLHLPHQARQAYHGRQPQHSSYEPEVASTFSKVSYSESARPRRRYSLHYIYFSGAHGHTTAGPPQSLRGSRRRGRIVLPPAKGKQQQNQQKGIHFMGTLFLLLCLSGVSLFPVPPHLPPGCFRLSFFFRLSSFFKKRHFFSSSPSFGLRAFMSAIILPSVCLLCGFYVPSLPPTQTH